MTPSFPSPPKFNSIANGPGPDDFASWSNLYNWFTRVWVQLRFTRLISATQSTLPTLSAQDAGVIVSVSGFNHRLLWTGSAWTWAPGDTGSGYVQEFLVTPPNADGWHECDGTTGIQYLKPDGTLGTVDLPTTANTWYRT